MPRLGLCVRLGVFEFARGPDRVSMDGGAWIPLRIRYFPRWHHTGSYQLYTGNCSTKEHIDFSALGSSKSHKLTVKALTLNISLA